ncbi:alpha/beta fold hydrolase [Saccharopolyspora sp. NPDC050389]|uniref:esterase/lipase family protein n=1 Tax=Saccharopolyspora sp. NPDC050389 TaxID=3155516 RepID=UPI0033D163B2
MERAKSKTFILVHGAWHGPWCWSRVGEYLTARGHDVICPRLPSDTADAGQDEYLSAIEDALRTRSDVVLVAHSMSGLLAPLAVGNRAVSSLVLLAALVRRPGTTWSDNGLEPFAEPMRKVLTQATVDETGCLALDPADATELFYRLPPG